MFQWRMPEKCSNCPFHETGEGRHLRDTLSPGRFGAIHDGVLRGEAFLCHKTTTNVGNGTNLYCAGALELQQAHGIETKYMTMCRAFEGVDESKAEIIRRLRACASAGTKRKRTGGRRQRS